MKTIEEKAKAYDEALKAAIAAHKDEDRHLKATLERIFPELQESEDERIRKGLIKALSSIGKRNWGGIDVFESISWLEKQGESYTKKDIDDAYLKGICDAKHELEKHGEQKPIDKVEHECSCKYVGCHINNSRRWCHYLENELPYDRCNSYCPKYNIKPTEWSEEDETMRENIEGALDCYESMVSEDWEKEKQWLKSLKDRVQPQSKIEWSEKDEEMAEDVIKGCVSSEKAHHFIHTPKEVADWLKSLKDRIGG